MRGGGGGSLLLSDLHTSILRFDYLFFKSSPQTFHRSPGFIQVNFHSIYIHYCNNYHVTKFQIVSQCLDGHLICLTHANPWVS